MLDINDCPQWRPFCAPAREMGFVHRCGLCRDPTVRRDHEAKAAEHRV